VLTGRVQITYGYDAQTRLVTFTDPDNRTTTYGYDPAGNQVTKADPGGTCPTWPITYPPTLSTTAASADPVVLA
jgi:YD repeat-containing protein